MLKYLKISLLCLLLGLLPACGGGDDDDKEPSGNAGEACTWLGMRPKIVNGAECRENRSPVVRLELYLETYGGTRVGSCTGTLVTPDTVLTAAHCLNDSNLKAIKVHFGEDGKEVWGKEIVYNGGYTGQVAYDVGLIRLKEAVSWSTLPILVSRTAQAGETGAIFGYGVLGGDNDEIMTRIRAGYAHVTQADDLRILMVYKYDSNTCQGDSGGPLVVQNGGQTAVVGVTSSGTAEGCGYGDNSYFAAMRGVESFLRQYAPGAQYK